MSFEWFISLRYLKAKRKQTFISLITFISVGGVAIGVMALIVVLAVMSGAQEDIREKIIGANSHIIITGPSAFNQARKNEAIKASLAEDEVVAVSAFVFNQVIITSDTKVAGVVLRGVEAEAPVSSTDLGQYMTHGSFDSVREVHDKLTIEPDDFGTSVEVRRAGIILGKELAFNLRVSLDDPVTIVSPMGKMTPAGMAPISREYYVAGIFHAGMYEYDSSLALISLKQAQSLFRMGDRVTGVEVKVEDVYQAPKIARKIQETLGFSFNVRDWQAMNKNLFFALELEKTVIGLILVLIIFVAAFNIVSTLIMVVLEKTRDIAVLKALGASRKSVMKIFFLEGLIIGLIGIILGDIGGILLCELLDRYQFIKLPGDVYNLDTLPVSMKVIDIVTISLTALVVTTLAALYPAWSASKVDPAESLRYE